MENLQIKIEHDYAEALGLFREVESSLLVLQQAVQNDMGSLTLSNVDDNLSVISERLSKAIAKFIETTDRQFATVPMCWENQTSDSEEPQESLTT